jgi:hypothetical protein
MEFKQLTESQMEKVLKIMTEEEITFQMEDCHAWYFDAPEESEASEYKVTKESTALYYKMKGGEDWHWCFSIEEGDFEDLL